ncbi:MAG: hypothetical protein IMZ44_15260 [Planctomycetes bacterium]|nr:hypothetical protein [Planctomycetota bacterium]
MRHAHLPLVMLLAAGLTCPAPADVCNVKVVTDASPDYSDLPSLVHSMTAQWSTAQEKCWAVWYWNHIARRQTTPMILHGMALTDPVRQANDYGYTMCSTIAGINCGIWNQMGLKVKYWDISLHTVPECFYDGRWHMYDNSMSALYTLCDGKTIAGVEDIGREGACEASGGRTEPGHIARYHCLTATSPNGFLTGADCARDLEQEAKCFNPKGLKYRSYYNEWEWGHRYILNLRDGESYTRHYKSLGDGPEFYVPNKGKDPEMGGRYGLRGNGVWTFAPSLAAADWQKAAHGASHIVPAEPTGLRGDAAGARGDVIFRVNAANVITSQTLTATFIRKTAEDEARIAVSTNNGLAWKEVYKADGTGEVPAAVKLVAEVNGAYEVLVRVALLGKAAPQDAVLKRIEIQTTTLLNAKTQPRLNLGKNTLYVGAGDPTESIVFWPELQNGKYKEHAVEEKGIACDAKHINYQGVVWPSAAKEDAYLVYRMDAPRDITRVTFGGRFYNRAPNSHIDFLYSLDNNRWTKCWSLTDTGQPWDVVHYETVEIPKGNRRVWLKYLMNSPQAARDACSIYSVRMEANYPPADTTFQPILVQFIWQERQADGSLVLRDHQEAVEKTPHRYTINVGGQDHPVMHSLLVSLKDPTTSVETGYGDGKDPGGEKCVGRWLTVGKNLAVGKTYTLSAPSETNWSAGDPDGKKLTDGVAGPPYAGGTSYRSGALWKGGTDPVITLDLGEAKSCAAIGMNFHGYPWWDALKGEIQDKVEVLVSTDGKQYASLGFLQTDLRWKDLPVNHLWPDHEVIQGATFRLVPPGPVEARYVQYKVTNKRFFCCTELEVLDAIRAEPFDLRVALPDEKESGAQK